jgi:2-methylisocitrate lyase-like PEP mutase family enzyme
MTTRQPPVLRDLLQPGAGLILPGAFDALAARLVEAAGFPALYLTGAGVANAWLGAPDMGLVSVTEVAAHVAACREAVAIPIVADGDTGFGNALNLVRTVRLFERAGANAIQLEDQVFPKRCGHFEGKAVIPIAEMVQKIHAAVDTRSGADFLVIARTDARAVEGFDAAIDRAAAYREAGADLLFVEAPASEAELRAIPQRLPGGPPVQHRARRQDAHAAARGVGCHGLCRHPLRQRRLAGGPAGDAADLRTPSTARITGGHRRQPDRFRRTAGCRRHATLERAGKALRKLLTPAWRA